MPGIKKVDQEWLKKVINDALKKAKSKGLNKLDCFKVVIKSVLVDAIKTLEDAQVEWELDNTSQEIREKLHLVHHYLDYLKRFLEKEKEE